MRRVILLAVLWGGAAPAEILWRGDFETGDLSQWSGALNPALGARKNIFIVESPVFQGRRAAKIDIHPDDLFPNGHNRVELHYDARRTGEGQEAFFSLRFLLPEHAKVHEDIAYWETQGPSYQQSMALYIDPSDAGTRLGFRTNLPAAREHFSGALRTGEWHQIAMHVVWSQSPERGRVSLWFDGEQVVHDAPAQTKPNGAGLFVQAGLHRDSSQPFSESISLDDAIEATSIEEVLSNSHRPRGQQLGDPLLHN